MKSILIIEDDIVFSRTISNWLVKQGMKTQCVATIAEARRAIAGEAVQSDTGRHASAG